MILHSARESTDSPIDWSSPSWGQAGSNVHYSGDGSYVPDRHKGD